MSKIIKKISASLILILMLFSISYNVLDYGYKVYAANTVGITDLQFMSNVENMEYYDPTKSNMAAISFRKNNVKKIEVSNNDLPLICELIDGGYLEYIYLKYTENFWLYCEVNKIKTIVFLISWEDTDGNTGEEQIEIPIKYEVPQVEIFNVNGLEITSKEDGTYSGIVSFEFKNLYTDLYSTTWDTNLELGAINCNIGTINIDSNGTTVNDLKQITGKNEITCTLSWTAKTTNAKSGSYEFTIKILDNDSGNVKIENVAWVNSDNELDPNKDNDTINLCFEISNYKNGVEPTIAADKFNVTQLGTSISGTTKSYTYSIKLKDGQTYTEKESISILYKGAESVSETIRILQASLDIKTWWFNNKDNIVLKEQDSINLQVEISNMQENSNKLEAKFSSESTYEKFDLKISETDSNYVIIITLKKIDKVKAGESYDIFLKYGSLEKNVTFSIKENSEEPIRLTNFKQGSKELYDSVEGCFLDPLEWNKNDNVTIVFQSSEEISSIALLGYEITGSSKNHIPNTDLNEYKYIFKKSESGDDDVKGKDTILLTIKTKKSGTKQKDVPIKNTPEDTSIIEKVSSKMSDDGQYYYIYVYTIEDEKYTSEWCVENIILEGEDASKLNATALPIKGKIANQMAFSIKLTEELKGQKYIVDIVVKENGEEIDRKEDFTFTILTEEFKEGDLIITNQQNLDKAKQNFKDEEYRIAISSQKLSFKNTEIEFWITKYSETDSLKKTNSVFCAAKDWHMYWNKYYHVYEASLKEISDEEKYALIYLNEYEIKNGTPEESKYYLLQAYIWTRGKPLNCGNKLSLENDIEDSYISIINNAIVAAKEAVNNGGSLTLADGRKVKVSKFTLTYYTLKALYSIYTMEKVEIGEEIQPFITFDYELEEGGGIQLQKADEQGNPLEATFIVLEYLENEAGAWYKLDEYTTNSETGLTETIPTKSNTKYAIFETKAPEGYTPTKQYAIVEVDQEGNCTYKIYEVSEENLNKDGYINIDTIKDGNGEEEGKEYIVNKDFIEDGTEVEDIENADWNSGEVKADGKVDLLLVLTNKSKIPSLKIIKVDQDGVKIGNKGGKFEITVTSKDGQGNIVKTEILDKNGEINLSLIEEKITGTKLEITVKEIEPPEGYEQPEITEITFTVEYTEENEWEITELTEEEGFKVDIVNSVIQIQITNKKKKDIELQIQKEDENGMPLGGAGFAVECSGLEGLSGSLTSGEDGKTSILTAKKENIKPGTYTVTITETTTPDGYEPIEKITFKITVEEDGEITVGKSSNALVTITTQTTEDTLKIIVTIKNKKEEEETTKKSGLELPLIMTISGQVWLDQTQGKNSETNGLYEKDEELEGITVKVYESDGVTPAKLADKGLVQGLINNEEAKQYLGEYYSQIQYKIGFIPDEPVVKTDSRGIFIISGLDPEKYYTLVFEYNGMRYSEIKASITIEGCGTPTNVASTTTAQTVQEDKERRDEITAMFSEIGPYPNNYSGGLVFTQTEVEKYIQTREVPTGATSADIEKFIANTTITAKIENLGGILSECEGTLRGYNSGLDSKTGGSYVFPVVKKKAKKIVRYSEGYSKVQEWINQFKEEYKKDSDRVGYSVLQHEESKETTITYIHRGHGNQRIEKEVTADPFIDEYKREYLVKDFQGGESSSKKKGSTDPCGASYQVFDHYNYTYDKDGKLVSKVPVYRTEICTVISGVAYQYDIYQDRSYWKITEYFVDEGYSNYVEEGNTNHTRISVWDTANEPLYDYDKISGNSGEINGKWGWLNKLTGIDDNNLENGAKEGIGNLFAELDKKINSKSPTSPVTDLCLVYMPTVDLGLYDDVQKAVVTINGQEEKYIYDKRLANGTTFQFGVNEYDIENSKNVKGNVEEAYADYYQSLTNGKPDGGTSEASGQDYNPIGIRKEDIVINKDGTDSKTNTGSATAGYYNDYEVKIEMVYKIKLYNQAAVSAHVTSIWDYYQDTFEFDGVYSDADCTQPMSVSVKDATNKQIEGYKVKEINLGSIELPKKDEKDEKKKNSYEIFIKLHMTNPKITLGGDVLDAGYATWNYAEISGYGTKIGVIDIDSTPGDLIPEERFQNGPYDDDEGKSPTLIFKNPENASRTISGIMFEDITGKTEVKTYVGETREGDGKYTSEQDKPIKGATVQLIEVTETGEPLDSPNDYETGVRAETITKDDGTYEFNKVVASNYIVRFKYGNNYQTVLTTLQGYTNENSYNGESYENTIRDTSLTGEYWYTNAKAGTSYIEDDTIRRTEVTNNFANLTNENAEILSSWKDTNPVTTLVDQLIEKGNMYAETERMLLDVEYHPRYENKIVETEGNGTYEKEYIMGNINGGIVERERAELQITKKVSEISIVDSAGKEITGGKAGEEIKYVKWIQGAGGFLDLEIDSELLSGATLKITYAITVTNNSETSTKNPNTISSIQVIDYVSNNLNYDNSYGNNSNQGWKPITTENVKKYVNNTSLDTDDLSNKIDLSTYQTILITTFGNISAGKSQTKTLTLEKNLSSQEDSNFNYENQVEIVESKNANGRGDYSSIYGNLDPTTYTSRQGKLNWDKIETANPNGFPQQLTDTTVRESGVEIEHPNAIRLAEKDSGNAEEVIITPPTGAKGIVLETQHYILAITFLTTLAVTIILIKKYISLSKQ